MIATGRDNESIVTYVDYLSKRMEFFKLDFDKDIQAHTVTLTKCKEVHSEFRLHIKTAREVSLQFLATLTYTKSMTIRETFGRICKRADTHTHIIEKPPANRYRTDKM